MSEFVLFKLVFHVILQNYVRPVFVDDGEPVQIHICSGRHPVCLLCSFTFTSTAALFSFCFCIISIILFFVLVGYDNVIILQINFEKMLYNHAFDFSEYKNILHL